ncbi:MAG: trypsin-like peptidase domain-containing protein [Saprospiraceae bacterium]|nr:trypsin-like peptidase domain-containing protein [Saprospiraceae bacterium]
MIFQKLPKDVKVFDIIEGDAEDNNKWAIYGIDISEYSTNADHNRPNFKDENSQANDYKTRGSGFFVSSKGYIITNYHVVKEANHVDVKFDYISGQEIYKAKIVEVDKSNDLALIVINDPSFKNLVNLPYSISTSYNIGTKVYAIGFLIQQH